MKNEWYLHLTKVYGCEESYSSKYDYHILKLGDSAKYNAAFHFNFTMIELKIAIDATKDFGILKIVEWVYTSRKTSWFWYSEVLHCNEEQDQLFS